MKVYFYFLRLYVAVVVVDTLSEEDEKPCHFPPMDSDTVLQYYSWDKTRVDALSYQHGFCTWRCRGESKVRVSRPICWNMGCTPCFCRRPACEIYNKCCPDVAAPYLRGMGNVAIEEPTVNNSSVLATRGRSSSTSGRALPVLGCDYHKYKSISSLYIRSCLPDYRDNETVIGLCERELGSMNETVETYLRALDTRTHVFYRNRFCAVCNRVKDYSVLGLRIDFSSNQAVYKATNKDEMLRQLLLSDVDIMTVYPDDVTLISCVSNEKAVVDSCPSVNETDDLDEDIVNVCETQLGNDLRVYDKDTLQYYSNIFCFICNKRQFPYQSSECNCYDPTFNMRPLPFSLLLDLTEKSRSRPLIYDSSEKSSSCPTNKWASPDDLCYEIVCVPGKTSHAEGCVEALQEIRGLSYRLQLWMLPAVTDTHNMTSTNMNASSVLGLLVDQVAALLQGLSEDYFIQVVVIQNNSTDVVAISNTYWLECKMIANVSLTRTQFETQILDKFIKNNITVKNWEGGTLEFMTRSLLRKGTALINTLQSYANFNNNVTSLIRKEYKSKQNRFVENLDEFINVSELMMCQYVGFNLTDYSLTVKESSIPYKIAITIHFHVFSVTFSDQKELSKMEVGDNGELNVCLDLLDSKVNEIKQKLLPDSVTRVRLEGTSLAEYIVSVTCFVASIACLLLTLLTYSTFPVLRTEAGVNNMFLSCSLLLAQVCLLATSHIFRSSTACTLLGLTTHFLWLWMFTWSFICSLHMFRVFTAQTVRSAAHGGTAGTRRRAAFSLTCPALVVMSTALVSWFTSGGADLGYGSFSCYLNSTLLVGITLVCPLSIITVVNVMLFLIVVYKIYKVHRLRSAFRCDDQQVNWHVYVKLSSVTGAFWTVAIVAAALDNGILRLLSIILNGLQGVAIFISFICNRRVSRLYKELLVRMKPGSRSKFTM